MDYLKKSFNNGRYQVVKMEVFVPDHGHIKRREYCESIRVGMLYSPHKGILPKCRHYIIDNGAYRAWIKGEKTNGNEFFAYLGKVMKCIYPQPYFVVIPDIVAGGMESFEYSISCIGKIPEDMPRYFVVQDGMYPQTVEEIITAVDGLFVGGTTVSAVYASLDRR